MTELLRLARHFVAQHAPPASSEVFSTADVGKPIKVKKGMVKVDDVYRPVNFTQSAVSSWSSEPADYRGKIVSVESGKVKVDNDVEFENPKESGLTPSSCKEWLQSWVADFGQLLNSTHQQNVQLTSLESWRQAWHVTRELRAINQALGSF